MKLYQQTETAKKKKKKGKLKKKTTMSIKDKDGDIPLLINFASLLLNFQLGIQNFLWFAFTFAFRPNL